jgi:hypothetical protein
MQTRGVACAALIAWLLFGSAALSGVSQTEERRHLLNFSNKYSEWGRLDWTSDRVTYTGDMPVDGAAYAFFSSLYAGFSCVDGAMVHSGTTSPPHKKSKERLRQLVFYSVDGHEMVVVELEDKEVQYRGDFPVDPEAKAFFAVVGQLYQQCFVKLKSNK